MTAENHITGACKKKQSQENTNEKKKRNKAVKKIDNNEESNDEMSDGVSEEVQIFKISAADKVEGRKRRSRIMLSLKFGKKWKKVTCDLDTCSEANVIGLKNYCKLANVFNPVFKTLNDQLRSFGGGHIETVGEVEIPCSHKERVYTIVFQVVNVDHGPLLSEKTCLTLGLVKYCFKINKSETDQILLRGRIEAEKIVVRYSTIFQGYGLMPGEVELEIYSRIKLVVQKARRIPISVRNDLKKKIKIKIKTDNFG